MQLIPYYQSRQKAMISLLKQLVYLESPSVDKAAVDKCSEFLAQKFRQVGTIVTSYPQSETGDLFTVEYVPAGVKPSSRGILVLGHTDTVWPVGTLQKMPFCTRGDKLFGPGVLDMKSGLVMVLTAIETLIELNLVPRTKILIYLSSCEEISSKASDKMIRKLARRSDCVLCLEPAIPGGALKMQRKGRQAVLLKTSGKTAHAGNPDKGINAIEELLLQLKLIARLKSKSISINLGKISGGENINTVPQEAFASLDIRYWTSLQENKISEYLQQLKPQIPGASVNYTIEKQTAAMEMTSGSRKLFKKSQKIAQELGLTLTAGKTGGGSDASLASNMHIPTLDGLGPDGDGIHAVNEHILISSFLEKTALLTKLLLHL